MKNKRTILAFLIAPMVPSIYFLAMMDFANKNVVVMMLVYSVCFSYLPSFLFGIPLMLYLKKKHHLNLANVVMGGVVAGVVVFYVFGFVFSAMLDSSKSLVPLMSDLIWGALLGASIALPLSLIAGIPIRKGKNGRTT